MSVLVMGGTRGLGLALANEAVLRGLHAVATGTKAPPVIGAETENPRFVWQDFTAGYPLGLVDHLIDRFGFRPNYVFWVGGIFLKGRLVDKSHHAARMAQVHLSGPMAALAELHRHMLRHESPYHLVVIGSTSSYTIRENETIYCALKAAKAAFARNFARELARELPGSKTTLANPGAMKTGFFDGTDIDASRLMDPAAIARIVWDRVAAQTGPYDEFNIENDADDWSVPVILDGIRPPESPF